MGKWALALQVQIKKKYKFDINFLTTYSTEKFIYIQNDRFIQGNSLQHYNSKRLETIYMFISKGHRFDCIHPWCTITF